MSKPTGAAWTRRELLQGTIAGTALAMMSPLARGQGQNPKGYPLRLGGPVFEKQTTPEAWVKALQRRGYSAAYCPLTADASDDEVRTYAKAAREAHIVIAEVGAWSNPLSDDEAERRAALAKCRGQLALAERIGARCCVNISGSRGSTWAGPDKKNLTPETFDMIVEVTRQIIDDVRPTRTFFTLEAMPWAYPDSADAYARLIEAMDRRQFAVHLDPVNLVCSPQIYYRNGALIRECFAKLGPHIRSCHAKDTRLDPKHLTTQLSEVRPGLGELDYTAFLTELSRTGDIPLMMEHLSGDEEYRQAAQYIRQIGTQAGLSFA
jgi:sugar phosphate isomerase/epimerase